MAPSDLEFGTAKRGLLTVFRNWEFPPEFTSWLFADNAAELAGDMGRESYAGSGQVVGRLRAGSEAGRNMQTLLK
jgi:hypothetical protein